ncbi:dnaJ homolog subfamily C member 11 isoform X2 [Trichogramma pretiosum]|uniref:dnaJ homolog subfamily C member 11 isoform X2 n=1 Tax=Trichogramma pretiosum TaxID=7493 RepID=UPI0006C94806|nr:dnaJ homolog subfamily C member 11 isoform X2 [Trichogramma pretiosum]
MDEDERDPHRMEEDFYTFLNVPRNATPEEISNAYRRLSKCYHPDKHTDPNLKKDAEILFNRTSKAYEVLSDPHKRAIYDSLGIRGLDTEGWEIALRTKTPQELREEYERLAKEEEERRLLMRTNPKGSVTVNINATDFFSRYTDDYSKDYDDVGNSIFSAVEVSGMSLTQSIEAPLTLKDTAVLGGELGIKNGVGSGSINFAVRRLVSQRGWFEVEVGAGSGPTLGFRGYRSLTKRIFFNGGTVLRVNPNEITPGFVGTLTMQLDTHTIGYLTCRAGIQSGMNTTIVRSTPQSYTAFSIEFALLRSFVSLSYTHKLEERQLDLKGCVKLGTFGWFVEYGAEKKLSQHTTVSAMVHVGTPTGVSLRIKLKRAYQTYNFPIRLSDDLYPAPVFYATVAPLISWVLLKNFVVDPIIRERKQRDRDKQREANKRIKLEKQREAKAAIDLMKATFSRIRAEEEQRKGLVITKALYGRFVYPHGASPAEEAAIGQRDEIIDVTIPLQCLVKDSKLVLHNASKSQLPGFYDPCVGEDKQLLLQYLFHMQTHECLVKDAEPLRIPKPSHRVNTT